jgi:drug/metabolite transporter (DMT)-like permease
MSQTLKHSLYVFVGGCIYGLIIPFVRIILNMGFTPSDAMICQYFASLIILAVAVVLFSRKKISLKQLLQLLLMGVISALVSLCYYNALAMISASASVTLLFQFVWMGLVVQAFIEKKAPNLLTVISVIVIMIGTVLAVGIVDEGIGNLNLLGVLYGFASAIFYTALLFCTSKIATDLPPINRTLFSAMGSFLFALCINSAFFIDGVIFEGILWAAIPLGLVGLVLPISLISSGSPYLPAGITTILAAGELPCGVLAAVIFLGEPITPLITLGLVIILGGIVLSQAKELKTFITRRRP